MKVVIKATPEDFLVEEIAQLPLKRQGEFAVYRLTKQGWNTVGALLEISRQQKIPWSRIAYAGKKDRYGLTSQYITIRGAQLPPFEGNGYSLTFCGWMQRPMGPDLIVANQFRIIVRKLTAAGITWATRQAAAILRVGYPNYFDDQRFGSFEPAQGFLADKLLKGQFNGAFKLYLTANRPQETLLNKAHHAQLFTDWGKWDACLRQARTEFERKVFSYLKGHPKGFLFLLRQLHKETLSLSIAGYQAYLWNELLRRLLRLKVNTGLLRHPGVAGEYLFYPDLTEAELREFSQLQPPTFGKQPQIKDAECAQLYRQLLQEQGITAAMLNRWKTRQAFFKSAARPMLVVPADFAVQEATDELYPGRKKLELRFQLPRGSYGTMLVKRLFCES